MDAIKTWHGSWLTERHDLGSLQRTLQWAKSHWRDEEAIQLFTVPINRYNFFIKFKDMVLSSYYFYDWPELEATLYDSHIAVKHRAGYAGKGCSFHLLKYDNLIIGYAAKDLDGPSYAHLNSKFEVQGKQPLTRITASPSENVSYGASPSLHPLPSYNAPGLSLPNISTVTLPIADSASLR